MNPERFSAANGTCTICANVTTVGNVGTNGTISSPNVTIGKPNGVNSNLFIYFSLLSRSFSDHHLRCGGWLNFEFIKREKHLGWAIKTIDKK